MGIGISNKAQAAHQCQTEAEAIKQRRQEAVKADASSISSKTNQRDVFEPSSNDKFDYYGDYDGYANIAEYASSLRESILYRYSHTVGRHNATWVMDEVGNDLRNMKEEKGAYNGSDLLNAYGYTYARLYDESEQRFENGDELWFDLSGKPLTKEEAKEKELEELNKAYEGAVEWAASCAYVMAGIQRTHWSSISGQTQNYDKAAQEIPEMRQKDREEMKRAFYEARDRYMELYKECIQTGNPLTRQGYVFDHNALLGFLAKTWSEDTHR
ncbi:MAG: hypothetical protein J1E01_02270 [Acetatifactor sp.]|nr:hypothetical protein [Acetatifactor sp.]